MRHETTERSAGGERSRGHVFFSPAVPETSEKAPFLKRIPGNHSLLMSTLLTPMPLLVRDACEMVPLRPAPSPVDSSRAVSNAININIYIYIYIYVCVYIISNALSKGITAVQVLTGLLH